MNCLPLQWKLSRNITPYDEGVFSTCAQNGLCFHRNHFRNKFIDVIKPDGTELKKWTNGEDPRVFEIHGNVYLVTNYLNNMKLLKLNGTNISHSWNLPFSGKNIMPINANYVESNMQFIDIQNKKIYILALSKTSSAAVIDKKISYHIHLQKNPHCFANLQNCVFRGGTTGIKSCKGIVGVGHCTMCPNRKFNKNMRTDKSCSHKPFLWYYQKNLSVFPLCLSSKNIIDPTTIHRKKLLTSESDTWWFTSKQTFLNREYSLQK